MLGSIACLDTSANIWELWAWRIHLIRCTWSFVHPNKELASTIKTWTADMSSGRYPGLSRIASHLTESYFVALLHVILLNFILYLPLYTSVYIPQLHFIFINMDPMASQVRNHYEQKNREAHLERAPACALNKTANLHCWSNVWTSNPAFEYSVGDS